MQFRDLNKYKVSKNNNMEKVVNSMAFDYFRMNIKERCLFEYKLKDCINDVDKIAMASLVFIFIVPITSVAFENSGLIKLVLYFVLYIIMGRFVVSKTNHYKICKLYIEVITSIKNEEIIQEGTYAVEIRFISKEE